MSWLALLGVLGLIVGLSRALPQLIRLLRIKDAAGVSVDGSATASIVSTAWTTYGLLTDQPAVVVASGTPALVFALITIASLRYGRSVREFRTAPVVFVVFVAVTSYGGAIGLGVALTVGALIANTPHVIVAYREKDLSGVSAATWGLNATDGAIWVTYALLTGDVPILVNNFFQFSTSALVVVRRWWWARSVARPILSPGS